MIYLSADISEIAAIANKDAAAVVAANFAASASLVVAIIALIGSFLTAGFAWLNADKAAKAAVTVGMIAADVTSINSRRTTYSVAVTSERSKWINSLRENIASLSGELRTLNYLITSPTAVASGAEDARRKINGLISLIALQLNPFGEIEANIRKLIESLPALAEKSDGAKLRSGDTLLIEHSRWLLKGEWDKVKAETNGIDFDQSSYLEKYQQFCVGYPIA